MNDRPSDRFLAALMGHVGLPVALLDRPGTSVIATADRDGTDTVVCYRAGLHSLVWGDASVLADFTDLADHAVSVSPHGFEERCRSLGFEHLGDGVMKVMSTGAVEPTATPDGLRHERLGIEDVDRVRAFCDGCDEADVDEAGLDELDDFREIAVNVLSGPSDRRLVAYGSATPSWDWDDAFADIGVLVDGGHRHRGLGRWVVARVVADLLDAGLLPLYRHATNNVGSDALSNGLGFETVTSLQAWRRTRDD